jgi:hypothetical protein
MVLDTRLGSGDARDSQCPLSRSEETPVTRGVGEDEEHDDTDDQSEAAEEAEDPPERQAGYQPDSTGHNAAKRSRTHFQGGRGCGETVPMA